MKASTVRALLALLVVIAAGWRFAHLAERSLWLDEVSSVAFARMDAASFWSTLAAREANMALYYVLLRFWIAFGESELWLRTPSVLAALATVPAIYALGRRLFDARVGLFAACLLAFNAFHVRQAQQARSYSLLVLLVTLSTLALLRSTDRRRRRDWALYGGLAVATVYAHFFGALAVAAQFAALVWRDRAAAPWRGLAASATLIGVASLPLVGFVLTRDVGQLAWVVPPSPRDVFRVFSDLSGGSSGALWALAVAGAFGLASTRAPYSGNLGFVAALLLVPVLVAYVFSHLSQPIFVGRYFAICLPALLLLGAYALSRLPRQWAALALALLLVIWGERIVRYYRKSLDSEDWRAVSRYVAAEAGAGDAVVFYHPYVRLAFEHYRERLGLEVKAPVVVPSPWNAALREPDVADPSPELIAGIGERAARVWLVLSHHDNVRLGRDRVTARIQESLRLRYTDEKRTAFTGVQVIEYSGRR